jgi:hypothetical protein
VTLKCYKRREQFKKFKSQESMHVCQIYVRSQLRTAAYSECKSTIYICIVHVEMKETCIEKWDMRMRRSKCMFYLWAIVRSLLIVSQLAA